jgi:hypothetical protein
VKTKTAYRYREKIPAAENNPAPSVEIDDQPVQPSETTTINFDTEEPNEAVAEAIQKAAEADDAAAALMKQLAHLRASEQAQREFATQIAAQRAAQMAAPAPTLPAEPEARIALWRQHGLTDDDAAFLEANPELVADPQLTRVASDEAALHHERDTDAHRAATLEAFRRLQGQQARARPAAADPAGFFQPSEPSRSPAAPDRAALYSAPVSRTASPGSYREPSPRSVKLTGEESAIAAASGISDVEYARQKLRMLKAKASGELQ